jgi:hypothetical protein
MKKPTALAATMLMSAACAFADFSYEQTAKLTGGAMAGMMKVAGVFSKKLRDPIQTSVLVSGDRMATVSQYGTQVWDLSKETLTDINFEKKTYSVTTFAQLEEAMKAMEAKMKTQKGEVSDVTYKIDVKDTGQSKQIAGHDTRQVIVTIEMEGQNKDSGKRETFMVVTADTWMAPDISGYDEVQQFYQRMAQKMSWMPSSTGMFAQGRSDISKGMTSAMKELAKVKGVPVFQILTMGMTAQGQRQEGAPAPAADQQPEQQPQQQQVDAERPSVGGALRGLGRFGGLGRKKKQEQQQAESGSPQPQGDPGALMVMTSELSGFSTGAVDASKMEVPAGYKQVDSEMVKALRK